MKTKNEQIEMDFKLWFMLSKVEKNDNGKYLVLTNYDNAIEIDMDTWETDYHVTPPQLKNLVDLVEEFINDTEPTEDEIFQNRKDLEDSANIY